MNNDAYQTPPPVVNKWDDLLLKYDLDTIRALFHAMTGQWLINQTATLLTPPEKHKLSLDAELSEGDTILTLSLIITPDDIKEKSKEEKYELRQFEYSEKEGIKMIEVDAHHELKLLPLTKRLYPDIQWFGGLKTTSPQVNAFYAYLWKYYRMDPEKIEEQ